MDRMTVSTVACLVDRGRSQVRVEVPEHEVSVLRAVHGSAEVRVLERDVDEMELEVSAEAEWDRLCRTYRRIGAADPVRFVWPDGPVSLERFGFRSDINPVDRETELRVITPKRRGRPKTAEASV